MTSFAVIIPNQKMEHRESWSIEYKRSKTMIKGGIATGYEVREQILVNNRPQEPLQPQGFVIHSTATPGATAQNEFNYFNSEYRAASAHYFVDWSEIIRAIPENEVAWHAGHTGNHRFLSVEMSEPQGYDTDKFHEVWKRTLWLVADACVRYGWTQKNVFSHRDISLNYGESNHTDPIDYFKTYGYTWEDLLMALEGEIDGLQKNNGGGDDQVDNLILVGRGADERAAGYLADYLQAPILYLDRLSKGYLDAAKKIYVVGGSSKPVERAILISGGDRYATCQKVLDFIRTGKV